VSQRCDRRSAIRLRLRCPICASISRTSPVMCEIDAQIQASRYGQTDRDSSGSHGPQERIRTTPRLCWPAESTNGDCIKPATPINRRITAAESAQVRLRPGSPPFESTRVVKCRAALTKLLRNRLQLRLVNKVNGRIRLPVRIRFRAGGRPRQLVREFWALTEQEFTVSEAACHFVIVRSAGAAAILLEGSGSGRTSCRARPEFLVSLLAHVHFTNLSVSVRSEVDCNIVNCIVWRRPG